jgi:hypothetical protein
MPGAHDHSYRVPAAVKAIKVRKGVVFGARLGVPDRRIGKDHRTNSLICNEELMRIPISLMVISDMLQPSL